MHRALKATTCLIFHGHCASCLYFLLRYHFPCRSKVPQTVSPREAAVRLGVTANLADNKRLSLGAVSGDKSCGGEGGEPRVSTSGTVQKVTSRSFAARALTRCERLRYSLLPVRVRPFHAKARKEERWERGIVFLSPSHSLSFPLPSSRCNQFRRLRKPHLFSRNRIFRSSSSPASIFIEKIPLGTAPAAVVLRQGAASNGAA